MCVWWPVLWPVLLQLLLWGLLVGRHLTDPGQISFQQWFWVAVLLTVHTYNICTLAAMLCCILLYAPYCTLTLLYCVVTYHACHAMFPHPASCHAIVCCVQGHVAGTQCTDACVCQPWPGGQGQAALVLHAGARPRCGQCLCRNPHCRLCQGMPPYTSQTYLFASTSTCYHLHPCCCCCCCYGCCCCCRLPTVVEWTVCSFSFILQPSTPCYCLTGCSRILLASSSGVPHSSGNRAVVKPA